MAIIEQHAARSGDDLERDSALARAWLEFAAADTARAFAERWLAYLHTASPELRGGAVLVADGDAFAPLARWPRELELAPLADCAEAALAAGGAEAVASVDSGVGLAFPIKVGGAVTAVAVFAAAGVAVDDALRQRLRWSLAWIELLLLRRQAAPADRAGEKRVFNALQCVAAVVDRSSFQASANSLVTELATLFECDRVTLGLYDGATLGAVAVSNTAVFGQQMNVVRLIEAAMDEALDQDECIVWPPAEDRAFLVTLAHDRLAQSTAHSCLCTVPLTARGEAVGALLCERGVDRPFDARDVELFDVVGSLVAAPLVDQRAAGRWLGAVARDRARTQLARLFGPGFSGRKLALTALVALVLALSFASGTYRVTADAVVKSAEQRAITAPIDGYIADAPARGGDRLAAGALLLALDDRDLQLERLKLTTEASQLEQQRKQAVAAGERANAKVLEAQQAQGEARIALLDEQLRRTRVQMPFDGIVVAGDFTQALGSPVRRGDPLYDVAPSDGFHAVLDVDESQLDDVEAGADGRLILKALPGQDFDLTVTRVTPVTKAREGANYFEVEAILDVTDAALRPGMRGVAKVTVGPRKLVWIWTRSLRSWLVIEWWRWWP